MGRYFVIWRGKSLQSRPIASRLSANFFLCLESRKVPTPVHIFTVLCRKPHIITFYGSGNCQSLAQHFLARVLSGTIIVVSTKTISISATHLYSIRWSILWSTRVSSAENFFFCCLNMYWQLHGDYLSLLQSQIGYLSVGLLLHFWNLTLSFNYEIFICFVLIKDLLNSRSASTRYLRGSSFGWVIIGMVGRFGVKHYLRYVTCRWPDKVLLNVALVSKVETSTYQKESTNPKQERKSWGLLWLKSAKDIVSY